MSYLAMSITCCSYHVKQVERVKPPYKPYDMRRVKQVKPCLQ